MYQVISFLCSRSEIGVSSEDFHEPSQYAASVIGIGREEREDYPIQYPFPAPSHWRGSLGHSPSSSISLQQSRLNGAPGGHNHYTKPPLHLANLGQMLKRLQYSSEEEGTSCGIRYVEEVRYGEEEELRNISAVEAELEAAASNTESSRACEDSPQLLGPSDGDALTVDTAGGGQGVPFRNSPSLFSDPFKLEMSSSIHT